MPAPELSPFRVFCPVSQGVQGLKVRHDRRMHALGVICAPLNTNGLLRNITTQAEAELLDMYSADDAGDNISYASCQDKQLLTGVRISTEPTTSYFQAMTGIRLLCGHYTPPWYTDEAYCHPAFPRIDYAPAPILEDTEQRPTILYQPGITCPPAYSIGRQEDERAQWVYNHGSIATTHLEISSKRTCKQGVSIWLHTGYIANPENAESVRLRLRYSAWGANKPATRLYAWFTNSSADAEAIHNLDNYQLISGLPVHSQGGLIFPGKSGEKTVRLNTAGFRGQYLAFENRGCRFDLERLWASTPELCEPSTPEGVDVDVSYKRRGLSKVSCRMPASVSNSEGAAQCQLNGQYLFVSHCDCVPGAVIDEANGVECRFLPLVLPGLINGRDISHKALVIWVSPSPQDEEIDRYLIFVSDDLEEGEQNPEDVHYILRVEVKALAEQSTYLVPIPRSDQNITRQLFVLAWPSDVPVRKNLTRTDLPQLDQLHKLDIEPYSGGSSSPLSVNSMGYLLLMFLVTATGVLIQ